MCLHPRLGGLGRPCPWRASIGSSSLRHHGEPVWAGGVRYGHTRQWHAERRASEIMLKAKRKAVGRRITAGEDKAYDTANHSLGLDAGNSEPQAKMIQ